MKGKIKSLTQLFIRRSLIVLCHIDDFKSFSLGSITYHDENFPIQSAFRRQLMFVVGVREESEIWFQNHAE